MKRFLTTLLATGLCLSASALIIDGKLDEAEWKSAKKYGNFNRLQNDKKFGQPPAANTEFYLINKPDAIYLGIKCEEPGMKELKEKRPTGPWGEDAVEIFIAPDGGDTEYYQFLVTFSKYTFSQYYAEGGNISPDPFAPVWQAKTFAGDNFWSAEIEFPLEVFYMTRQNLWKSTWRFNVARTRTVGDYSLSSWSKLKKGFPEPKNFNKLDGFPIRPAENDVLISYAGANINGLNKDGKPYGELTVKIQVPTSADYEFNGKKYALKAGANTIATEYTFEKEGRNQVFLSFKRLSDGKIFSRYYPVVTNYVPIRLQFTLPEYRKNFYPGQDFSKIQGSVVRSGKEPVTLTLEGAGIPKQTLTLKGSKLDFSFNSSSMQDGGTAILTAVCGKDKLEQKIRRVAKTGHPMSWISNGNLVVDGKPIIRCNMYADGYMGGVAFAEKYKNDKEALCITDGIHGNSVGPEWQKALQLEVKEAKKDVYPCDEYLANLRNFVEEANKKNYLLYYICDEPECRNVSPVYLQHVYEYLCEIDPSRVVLMGSRACTKYLNCADWFETHPYINAREENGIRTYDREINTLGNYVDEIALLNRPDKCIGCMPTCFGSRSSFSYCRYPTFEEIVCLTWAFFIRGCKTLQPYAYHDMGDMPCLYEGMRYIFSSAKALQDYILNGKRTLLFNNKEAGAALFELADGRRMFAAVNYSTKPVTVDLSGIKGKYNEFRGTRTFKAQKYELAPHEVYVGITDNAGKELKTYAQVVKEIAELEYQRTHTGNLIFGHENDVEVAASKPTPSIPYKMFDGTRDVIAFYDNWSKEKFYEIAFPKPDFIPEFSRVRIYGNNLGDPKIKIRKRGKWLDLTPSQVNKDKYMVEYIFPESYKTVKFHVDFPLNKMELYEIELHK